ncbi:hypothetical protein BDP27DRAFT_1370130 [Rhodocollybia butyracea]|uniref:Uncharacterized protein n=1 Tax=Rhodocollybia butyracea TaxID=206335 RepID=A0A9P5PEX5_9AGAR|nr:hypothetical protein BDP27DRAFT_1370130 [Rhodocollybia butyracea]
MFSAFSILIPFPRTSLDVLPLSLTGIILNVRQLYAGHFGYGFGQRSINKAMLKFFNKSIIVRKHSCCLPETFPGRLDPTWYIADHEVAQILDYTVLHFHTPDRPIPIPLDKDCRETAWLGEQDPVDDGIPGAPGPVSDGEEEEGNSDVPSESERSAYEAPPSHSRNQDLQSKENSSCSAAQSCPKKLKNIPALKVIPKASKAVKTPIVSKNSRTPKTSLEVQELKSSKGKLLVMETKAAGPSKGKTKTKDIKGKGKEVVPDPVVPPSLKRKRLNNTEDEAEASTLPTPTLAPKLKASKKLVPMVEIPVPMASGSKGKVTVPLESSREPTPTPAPPENLVFLVPDEDVDSLDLDGLFQDLASRSSKEFVASGSTEYRTVIVHFERDALDLPSFKEILPRGNQKPKELFQDPANLGYYIRARCFPGPPGH